MRMNKQYQKLISINNKWRAYDTIEDLVKIQSEEIERLNNDIKILLKENENKEKVIIKQNNIIEELEKWLKEENEYSDYKDVFYREHMGYVLDKIQELKEKQ